MQLSTSYIINIFAENGYQLEPEALLYFKEYPISELTKAIQQINKKGDNILVIDFSVIHEILKPSGAYFFKKTNYTRR